MTIARQTHLPSRALHFLLFGFPLEPVQFERGSCACSSCVLLCAFSLLRAKVRSVTLEECGMVGEELSGDADILDEVKQGGNKVTSVLRQAVPQSHDEHLFLLLSDA